MCRNPARGSFGGKSGTQDWLAERSNEKTLVDSKITLSKPSQKHLLHSTISYLQGSQEQKIQHCPLQPQYIEKRY